MPAKIPAKPQSTPLRNWASASYHPETGRPAVASGRDSSPHCMTGDSQISTARMSRVPDGKMSESSSSQASEHSHQRAVKARRDGSKP
jgi:hypothetical protein